MATSTLVVTPFLQDHPMKPTYDERKFTELLLHVASRLQSDRSGGATKLNKVMFFAEFAHVRRTGRPISGAVYQKLEHGPAARRQRPVRDNLVAAGEASLEAEEFLGYQQHRLVPLRNADLSVFTTEELATIDKVLADLDGLNARQVSDLSHDEAGWQLVDFGDDIPYEAALVGARQVSTPTSRRLQHEAAAQAGLL
ncbi:MAG: SocA family protein, partial [Ilumatobacter sp.]|nr:SocA family protein [Ilumatobacter sp.]